MPTARERELVTASRIGGVNNVAEETTLGPVLGGRSRGLLELRKAENVNLSDSGKPRRRGGYQRVIAGTSAHSLWSAPMLDFALYHDAGEIRQFGRDHQPATVIAGVGADHDIAFELVNDWVYWTNGERIGRISLDAASREVAPERPGGQPKLAAATDGGLPPGRYQVAITYRDTLGQESGTGVAAVVELPAENGAIALSLIPQPLGVEIAAIRIYATDADGDVLYHRRDVVVGTTDFTLFAQPPGKVLATQFLEPLPAGHLLTRVNGRLLVARRNMLYMSEALRFGQHRPATSGIGFSGTITMLLGISEAGDASGCYVAMAGRDPASSGRTFWLGGPDTKDTTLRAVFGVGAVPGTGVMVPASFFRLENVPETTTVPYWVAEDGVGTIGLPGGNLVRLRENETIVDPADAGASLLRELTNGRQIITALRGRRAASSLVAQDSMVAEVRRHGVEVP